MITLKILGCGGGMPMINRFLSSTLIHYQGKKILLDCGEGTQVAMRNNKTGFKNIDIICITHLHGDHIFGLPGLLSTMGNSGRTLPVTIIGCIGIRDAVKGLLSTIAYLPFELIIIENPKNPLSITHSSHRLVVEEYSIVNEAEIILNILELDHSSSCMGFRFDIIRKAQFNPEKAIALNIPKQFWSTLQKGQTVSYDNKVYEPNMVLENKRKGLKISYITDTRPIEAISDFIKGSTLFICEGTYGDDADLKKAIKNKHMTFSEAAGLARSGEVKELLLTHFSTAIENAEIYKSFADDVFENTVIAYDGFVKKLSYKH